jgi:hypothetical protein
MQFAFGSGILWGYRTDVSGATPVRFGTLQDVSVDFSGDLKELFGQYKFPVDVAQGKNKIECKAKLARISAVQFNNLYFGQPIVAGQQQISFDEVMTLSTSGTGTAAVTTGTVANHSTFLYDLGIRYQSNGEPLVLVPGSPSSLTAVGEYQPSAGGTYYFNSGDVTNTMLADYSYTQTASGFTINASNQLMGASPRFRITLLNQYEGNQMVMTLYQCASSKLSLATKIDDYTIPELDFQAYQGANGLVWQLSASE